MAAIDLIQEQVRRISADSAGMRGKDWKMVSDYHKLLLSKKNENETTVNHRITVRLTQKGLFTVLTQKT